METYTTQLEERLGECSEEKKLHCLYFQPMQYLYCISNFLNLST